MPIPIDTRSTDWPLEPAVSWGQTPTSVFVCLVLPNSDTSSVVAIMNKLTGGDFSKA